MSHVPLFKHISFRMLCIGKIRVITSNMLTMIGQCVITCVFAISKGTKRAIIRILLQIYVKSMQIIL